MSESGYRAVFDHGFMLYEDCVAGYGQAILAELLFGDRPYLSKGFWDDATVGGLLRPLPRTWGVDRLPCNGRAHDAPGRGLPSSRDGRRD